MSEIELALCPFAPKHAPQLTTVTQKSLSLEAETESFTPPNCYNDMNNEMIYPNGVQNLENRIVRPQ